MTYLIIHLSDIHIKSASNPILLRSKEVASAAFKHLPNASHIFLAVSGDIAFSGRTEQYKLATDFIEGIQTELKQEYQGEISIIVCPGNHDCDFEKNTPSRDIFLQHLENKGTDKIDNAIIEACIAPQSDFFAFQTAIETSSPSNKAILWRRTTFENNGKTIAFNSINLAWNSKLKEAPGSINFPLQTCEPIDDKANTEIVMMHHPLNWINQHSYREFRTHIRKLASIVITGHEHQGTAGLNIDFESGQSAYIEGGVLQNEKYTLEDSSFNIILIDPIEDQFSYSKLIWNGTLYKEQEQGAWSNLFRLPEKTKNNFNISPSFQQKLDDPGIYLKHPVKPTLFLHDIFIFPDLRRMGESEDRRRSYVSSKRLTDPTTLSNGAIIEGDEKCGATSLLLTLYKEYHNRGYTPILIEGKHIKAYSPRDIDSQIKKAIIEQYSQADVPFYENLSASQKIILIDDLDDSPIKSNQTQAKVVSEFKKRCAHIIVTVSDLFEIKELVDLDGVPDLSTLTHYKLMPFGHALRGQLISRWLHLGADGTASDGVMIERYDALERQMDAIIQKSVIPSAPLYLLTLLQSIDSGRSGDFKNSALGHYYHYLLTEAFQSVGIKPEKLTEYFQYTSNLAWEFHQLGKSSILTEEFQNFNGNFSRKWHTVDATTRLKTLTDSKVLFTNGDEISFRYPYIYYYLKGIYLSENLQDLSIRAYIEKCCHHLYVRDHANTVLFLAHHTTDDFVLRTIAAGLNNLFRKNLPLRFESDTDCARRIIDSAPTLSYTGEKPTAFRAKANEYRDELDNGSDGLAESEEPTNDLSLLAQMTMLFKTMEILGQVLKNQYSKIQRPRKQELIEDLFNAPLRALGDFFKYFNDNPDALIADIEKAIAKKGKSVSEDQRNQLARKVVAGVIQAVTFSFVLRAAQSANSESLIEDISAVVKNNKSIAFKIIETGVHLDSAKPIRKSELKMLNSECKGDLIATQVLRLFALNHLYMFKTSEQDMQWLSKELNIDLSFQHAIAYQDRRNH